MTLCTVAQVSAALTPTTHSVVLDLAPSRRWDFFFVSFPSAFSLISFFKYFFFLLLTADGNYYFFLRSSTARSAVGSFFFL